MPSDAFLANENPGSGNWETMTNGAIKLSQAATGNFGSSGGTYFAPQSGALDFMSTTAPGGAFSDFNTGASGTLKLRDGRSTFCRNEFCAKAWTIPRK